MTAPTQTPAELSDQLFAMLDELKALKRVQASHAQLMALAERYIATHYAWQKAKYGKVKTRLNPSHFLRAN